MANRRCLLLQSLIKRHHHYNQPPPPPIFSTSSFSSSSTTPFYQIFNSISSLPATTRTQIATIPKYPLNYLHHRCYSAGDHKSYGKTGREVEEYGGGGGDDDEVEEGELSGSEDEEEENEEMIVKRKKENETMSKEKKEMLANKIGYKVIGPLGKDDQVVKPWEPIFAVIQLGSHQFKVSNGDAIYTERLKACEVNDKLLLNKVLMLGSQSQTIIGRPTLPDASVYALVEEHVLDATVLIFKKKRRKHYRRTKKHRQELTRLRITDIQGIKKPLAPNVGVAEIQEISPSPV